MKKDKIDITARTTEDLQKEYKTLKEKSKNNEENGKALTSTMIGPFVASIIVSSINIILGLIAVGIFGAAFLTGWGLTCSSINLDKKADNIKAELDKRPQETYTQIAMDKVLEDTYKPNFVKKSKQNIEEKDNNLGL